MPSPVGDLLHILPPFISIIPISQIVQIKVQSVYGTGQENIHVTPYSSLKEHHLTPVDCFCLLCFWLLLPSTGWHEKYQERGTGNNIPSLLLVGLGLKNGKFLEFGETSEKASVISLVPYLWSGCRYPSWIVRILWYNYMKMYRFS